MSLSDTIANWVVNDYFTPNIKAEVILDTLLTDYAAEIIKAQCGDKVDKIYILSQKRCRSWTKANRITQGQKSITSSRTVPTYTLSN